jgi:ubiquinone/menaquinone biosynthesis C-methylase UbiE
MFRKVYRILAYVLIGIPLLVIFLHTLIRIIRHIYKFPMPERLANLIDNPLRRRIQPPESTPARHGIKPGMTVLEVGPGNGTYTLATAKYIGLQGKIYTVDIEPKMIERVRVKANDAGVSNLEAKVADVYNLPFEDDMFDVVYLIAVSGEILLLETAIREFHRVLKSSGKLAFSELFLDPDYPLSNTLVKKTMPCGFQLQQRLGNFFYYTLIFEKVG